jgi:hypothetical protein
MERERPVTACNSGTLAAERVSLFDQHRLAGLPITVERGDSSVQLG